MPLALNAGNWLYFVPLETLSTLGVSPATELALHRRMAAAMARRHCGRALDVGLRVDALPPAEIAEIVRVVATLKTGTLTELGIGLGAVAAGADRKRVGAIERFGRRFDVALQMFDDLGNLQGARAGAPSRGPPDRGRRRPVARDRVEGTIAIPLFEQAVIGAWPSFLQRTPEITPDTTQSRFTLVRLMDAGGCEAVLAMRGAS